MSKYDRGEFSRFDKGQLLDYIEQQNEQLSRFETRFRGEWPYIVCTARKCSIISYTGSCSSMKSLVWA